MRNLLVRKLALALAILANAISFNAIAQTSGSTSGAGVCNVFKVTYDGSTQSLDAGSAPIQGTSLNTGDRFLLDIRAAGSGFFESKTANHNSTGIFASLLIFDCGTRTGNVRTRLLLDGKVVSQRTELALQQSCVHVGANFAPPPLTVGLRFDQILVDYEFLASTVAKNVLENGHSGEPVRWASFTDPNLFAFHQGSDPTVTAATATSTNSSTCQPFAAVVASGFNFPFGVAVHQGAVYIADRNSHTVWKMDASATIPVAGTGVVQQNADGSKVLVPGEAGYNGDGIAATSAQLDSPTGVAVGIDGALYIADSGNHAIRKVASPGTSGATITTVAGVPTENGLAVNGGPATAAKLFGPRGVAYAAGSLYIADTMNQQVRRVNLTDFTISAVAGIAGETGANDGAVSSSRLNGPLAVAVRVDASGNVAAVYVADEGNNKIRKVSGGMVETVASGLSSPSGVVVTADGTLYVADLDNNRIQRIAGTSVTTVLSALNSPVALALDQSGDLYIAELHRILKLDLP